MTTVAGRAKGAAMDLRSASALGAELVHGGFEDWHERFRSLTRRVQRRFERRDWTGVRDDTVERLALHARSVDETYRRLRQRLSVRLGDRALWVALKETYTHEILGRGDFEVAHTYFNSVVRRAFPHAGVDREIDFVATDFPPLPYYGWEMASARTFAVRRVDAAVVRKVLEKVGFQAPFADLEGDCRAAAERLRQGIAEAWGGDEVEALDVLRPLFVRNKAAYVVGRARRGSDLVPLVLCLLNGEDGLRVDAVLPTEDEASVVFSFARWYFHADVRNPREVIGFLHSILPRKRTAELYISLGYNKHGKTEFYGDLVRQIAATDEQFVAAPGKPGMVMSVFTLPSYEFVFKVIKDRFAPPKQTTAEEVREKYRQVMGHDRVGRLVDFQEFEHLEFPRRRFADELLAELLQVASGAVRVAGDQVVLRHLYVGRRVTPLDLFVAEETPERAAAAIVDWGHSIKDLAAADVFAGDIQLKNFGVTRHGRVVFYDYDELCPLAECNFRRFPPPRSPEEELAAEPWFTVADGDVFPEELRSFLALTGDLKRLFVARHGDLFGVGFWRAMQQRNRGGELIDFFPYADSRRLRVGVGAVAGGELAVAGAGTSDATGRGR